MNRCLPNKQTVEQKGSRDIPVFFQTVKGFGGIPAPLLDSIIFQSIGINHVITLVPIEAEKSSALNR